MSSAHSTSDGHSSSGGRHRLSQIRHDLRNPLGEIIGFTDLLIEEAAEQKLHSLTPGLERIRQLASSILADLIHGLNLETIRSTPDCLPRLKETVQTLSNQILQHSQDLSDQCDGLGTPSFADDLLRISGSARRLGEVAAEALAKLSAESAIE